MLFNMMKSNENSIVLPDEDLYLFGKGDARKAYLTFGCHKVEGGAFRFAVWAPGARSVHLVGDFNGWDETATPMRELRDGIYACEVEGLENGSTYKYCIVGADGKARLKADPYAFHAENGLSTASKVWCLDGYAWHDAKWLERRAKADALHEPMSIYELHLGSWRVPEGREFPNYREAADELAAYCKQMGYTHVELLPITEYPFPASWGYQVTGYFSPTSRYGTPQDFMYLIDTLHRAGIGVILDWVPAHFPKDDFALARFDGTPLYEYADPRKGEHAEWGTLVFDFAKPQVVSFLISSAVFFFDVYHIDGIRVDAVSSMLYLDYGRTDWVRNDEGGNINKEAVAFLKKMNEAVLSTFPGAITIAEESTSFPLVTRPPYDGGLGFTFKWDMGFMHDMLEYAALDPLWRRGSHDKLTFGMMYAFSENFVLAFSHDEVVHGKKSMVEKMAGDYEQRFANLRALMGYQFARPGKKLTFMGSEFGQVIEWDFQKELDWFLLEYPIHDSMRAYSAALNRLYARREALWKIDDSWAGFGWANVDDRDENAIAFIRYANDGDDALLACFNFSPVPLFGFKVGLPCAGRLRLVLNSDEGRFGGTDAPAKKTAKALDSPFENQPCSASLMLPPLSALYYDFKKETPGTADGKPAKKAAGKPARESARKKQARKKTTKK